ncbi:hypothetical protein PtrSN001A_012274, partial [Pyrenophora tritici-repentis]
DRSIARGSKRDGSKLFNLSISGRAEGLGSRGQPEPSRNRNAAVSSHDCGREPASRSSPLA